MTRRKTPTIPLGALVKAPKPIVRRYKDGPPHPNPNIRKGEAYWARHEGWGDMEKPPVVGIYTGYRNGTRGILTTTFYDNNSSTSYKATGSQRYAYIVEAENTLPVKVFYDDLEIVKDAAPNIAYCPDCGQDLWHDQYET